MPDKTNLDLSNNSNTSSKLDFLLSNIDLDNEDEILTSNPFFAEEANITTNTTNTTNISSNPIKKKNISNDNLNSTNLLSSNSNSKNKEVIIRKKSASTTTPSNKENKKEENSTSSSTYSYLDKNKIEELTSSVLSKLKNKLEYDNFTSDMKSKKPNQNKLANNMRSNYSKKEEDYDDITTCANYEINASHNNNTSLINKFRFNIADSPLDIVDYSNNNKNLLIPPFQGELFYPVINKNFYAGISEEELIKSNPGLENQFLLLKRRSEALKRIYTVSPQESEEREINIGDAALELNLYPELIFYLVTGNRNIGLIYALEKKYNLLHYYRLGFISKQRPILIFSYYYNTKQLGFKLSKFIELKKWLYEYLINSTDFKLRRNLRMMNMLLYHYEHMSELQFDDFYCNAVKNKNRYLETHVDKEVILYGTINNKIYLGSGYREKLILYIKNIREVKSRNISNIKSEPIVIDSLPIIIPNKFRTNKSDFEFFSGNEIAFMGKMIRNEDSDMKSKFNIIISYLETFMTPENSKKAKEYELYQKNKAYFDTRNF